MERLLIVEDDEIGRMVLWELLSDQYDCDLAFNGEEAIKKLSADEYGHVLLDLMMPKVDGFGVMDYLKYISFVTTVSNKYSGVAMLPLKPRTLRSSMTVAFVVSGLG